MQDVLLGFAKSPLQREKLQDSTLGILITDAMKLHAKAEISFVSSGTTKVEIDSGEIYSSDVDEAIPFKDSIVLMELTGAKVVEILEQSAKLEADSGGSGGKILQVSGIRFKYNLKLEKGKRVIEATINGAPISPIRIYLAAVSKYLSDGGDGYVQFKDGKTLGDVGELKTVVKQYIKTAGAIDIQRDMRIQYLE